MYTGQKTTTTKQSTEWCVDLISIIMAQNISLLLWYGMLMSHVASSFEVGQTVAPARGSVEHSIWIAQERQEVSWNHKI